MQVVSHSQKKKKKKKKEKERKKTKQKTRGCDPNKNLVLRKMDLNETEINDLPDGQFNIIVIKIPIEIRRPMHEKVVISVKRCVHMYVWSVMSNALQLHGL